MPDNKTLESFANWTFPGLTFYYRDTPLGEDQIERYQVNSYIRNNFFVDASARSDGILGDTRYLIASSKAAPIYDADPSNAQAVEWRLSVINAGSYFKVLDVFSRDGKTQITLLHIPKRWADTIGQGVIQLSPELQVIEAARQSFDQKVILPPTPTLDSSEWRDHIKLPIGIDPQGNLVALDGPLPAQDLPIFRVLENIIADTTGLNT